MNTSHRNFVVVLVLAIVGILEITIKYSKQFEQLQNQIASSFSDSDKTVSIINDLQQQLQYYNTNLHDTNNQHKQSIEAIKLEQIEQISEAKNAHKTEIETVNEQMTKQYTDQQQSDKEIQALKQILQQANSNANSSKYIQEADAIIPKFALQEDVENRNIPVFYNVFVKPDKVNTATDIFQEQMAFLQSMHKVFVRSIGIPIEIQNKILIRHDEKGSEIETLGLLWDHCRDNLNDKVVYIHNKGSFHPSKKNDILRRFLTRGALSKECSNMPMSCNVCSSRMTPIPHAQTPGNMWVARCDYVQKLIDPLKFENAMRINVQEPMRISERLSACYGWGRYAAEHWIHSHPSVRPCDLSTSSYTWNYDGVPEGDFEMRLEPAPRYELAKYLKKSTKCMDVNPTLSQRLSEYRNLYNETPSAPWWGWRLYNH